MGKAASMKPSEMLAGGRVPDGRYTIKAATAEVFNYGGTTADVPAACFVFKGSDGVEHEQYYSAGDMEYLVPSEDKEEFVHPRGEDAKFSRNTNFGKFIGSLLNAGYPDSELTTKLSSLVGADVDLVGQAQPKNQSGKESVLSLVTKYHGRVKGGASGKSASRPSTPASRAQTAPAAAKTDTKTASGASATSNGDVDEQAREQVLAALAGAPDATLTRQRLGTVVMTEIAKLKKDRPEVFANLLAIRKSVTDAAWLAAQAEAGGWTTTGEEVKLG